MEKISGYEKIKRLVKEVHACTTEHEIREILQQIYFIAHKETIKEPSNDCESR